MTAQCAKLPQTLQNAPTHANLGCQRFFSPPAVLGDGSNLGLDRGEVEALPARVALELTADVAGQPVGIARSTVALPDSLDSVAVNAKVLGGGTDVTMLEPPTDAVGEKELNDGNTSLGREVWLRIGRWG